MSGFLLNAVGFQYMMIIYGSLCVAFAPLMFFLRKPPAGDHATGISNKNFD